MKKARISLIRFKVKQKEQEKKKKRKKKQKFYKKNTLYIFYEEEKKLKEKSLEAPRHQHSNPRLTGPSPTWAGPPAHEKTFSGWVA